MHGNLMFIYIYAWHVYEGIYSCIMHRATEMEMSPLILLIETYITVII